jgi:hypothetical protein
MLRGWRKALYCALSDGTHIRLAPQKKPKTTKKKKTGAKEPSLFDLVEKGDI